MENLKHLRISKKLSQQKLADILHISQQSVYKYENNLTTPDIETLKTMADFFETSIDYIIGHTDIPDIIEHKVENALNAEEMNLIISYRNLTPKQREVILHVIESYSDKR